MKPLFFARFLTVASLLATSSACNSDSTTAPEWQVRSHEPVRASSAPLAQPSPESIQRMREQLTYLASDDLEGRGLTTAGIDRAADYIAEDFKQSGLQPLPGLHGYFQSFETVVSTTLDETTSLKIRDNVLTLKEDFTALGLSGQGAFDAPVAFVGYGISSDEHKYDDYAGIDVTGKVVLAMRYEPHDDDGDSRFDKDGWTDAASLTSKARTAAGKGAKALVLVNPAEYHGQDRLMPFTRAMGERASIPVVMITVEQADAILKQAGAKSLAELQNRIDSSGKPASFALERVAVAGEVKIERTEKTLRNVVGYLPGTGPQKDQSIIIGAHYDHLGKGERGSISRSSDVHNGADDNASGTVALMELARRLAQEPDRSRSVVFIAFTGEERGLLGSAHFVKEPPIKLDDVVAMINMDMVGRIKDDIVFVGGTGTAMPLEQLVARADERSGLEVQVAGAMVGGKGGIGPSDHESFALKKVPVIFFYSGMHIDYHRPTDDADKINYDGMARVVDMAVDLVEQLQQMPQAQYVDKYDKAFGGAGRGSGGSRVQLGIMPDYADGTEPGVRVSGTVPDTAAAKAGIQAGDVIIGIGDSKISGLEDYMTALGKHKPGDTVMVRLIREGKEIELDATLQERK